MLIEREMSAGDSLESAKGLAEIIHAGRMRMRAGSSGADVPTQYNRVRRPDCLADRIQQARERVRLARGPETLA
jgi:hypothetical protein